MYGQEVCGPLGMRGIRSIWKTVRGIQCLKKRERRRIRKKNEAWDGKDWRGRSGIRQHISVSLITFEHTEGWREPGKSRIPKRKQIARIFSWRPMHSPRFEMYWDLVRAEKQRFNLFIRYKVQQKKKYYLVSKNNPQKLFKMSWTTSPVPTRLQSVRTFVRDEVSK